MAVVTAGPSGTLLVVASPRIQSGVEAILGDLRKLDTPPPQPEPVKISYWILVGRPIGAERGAFTFEGGVPPDAIEPVLREIASAEGPMEFAMLEQFEVSSMERAEIAGSAFRVHQRTTRAGDQVVADVAISFLVELLDSILGRSLVVKFLAVFGLKFPAGDSDPTLALRLDR